MPKIVMFGIGLRYGAVVSMMSSKGRQVFLVEV